MLSPQTEFEFYRCTRYEAMNGGANCRKWGGLGWFGKLQGHSRSSVMSLFDRARMTSYLTSIKTKRLSCTVFEI